MKRREFIAFLGGATLMWVPAMRHAVAQQLTDMKRIAIANPSATLADMSGGDPLYSTFFEEMKLLEGKIDIQEVDNVNVSSILPAKSLLRTLMRSIR